MGILNWLQRPSVPSHEEIDSAVAHLVPPMPAPTDKELREEWLRDRYNDAVHVRQILFRVTAGNRETVRQLTEAVRARAVAGEDFAELAREFTYEPGGKERGGDLGIIPRGRMGPKFERTAFALQPGQISDVFETCYGYHVIQIEARQQLEMDDISEFRTFWVGRARRNAIRKYFEQMKREACVEVEFGAEEWVRQLALRTDSRVWGWTATHTLVRYRGGTVTVGDMVRILRKPKNARQIAHIATASDALLNGFLSDQAVVNLVWAAAQRSLSYPRARRAPWSASRSGRIVPAPGAGLIWFAEFFFSGKDSEEALRPVVADMRLEYFDACSRGRIAKARWVRARGTFAFVHAAFSMSPLGKALAWIGSLFRN